MPHKIGEVQNCASKDKVQKFSFSANRSQLDVFRSLLRLVSLLSWLERSSGGTFPHGGRGQSGWGGGASGSR